MSSLLNIQPKESLQIGRMLVSNPVRRQADIPQLNPGMPPAQGSRLRGSLANFSFFGWTLNIELACPKQNKILQVN